MPYTAFCRDSAAHGQAATVASVWAMRYDAVRADVWVARTYQTRNGLTELRCPMIRRVYTEDLERVREFLEAHVDTSLFLLSNLAIYGPRLAEHWYSGNYHLVEEAGRVVAVFCLTRGGNLLIQAGGRADLAESILEACDAEAIDVCGVAGEWPTAEALWELLRADPRFEPGEGSRDVLYRRPLAAGAINPGERPAGVTVRALDASDFDQWERLNTAYMAELRHPLPVVDAAHAAEFARRTRARWWWGAFVGSQLAATVALNAAYGTVGQVGGVYTRPADRKKGFARAAMEFLMDESREYHRFEKLILFTGGENHGARRLYESLGFEEAGAFGLLLGSRRAQATARAHHRWEGESGELYTYDVHTWPLRLSPGPGNFIFANSLGAGNWRPLQFGECADLATLADQARLRNSGGRQAPSHVHVHVNFNPAAARRREVNDLAARWLSERD
jgi:ribosomal protein S18 acetylase RimI-like enzyme